MIGNGPQFDPVAIVTRILARDQQAEEELIARFQPRIAAFLSARTSRLDFIEEVTQETMLAALCALREGRLREPENLSSFVYGVARNRFADIIRKQAREKTDPLPDGFDRAAPAGEQDPELLAAARREIASLETADRRILWMTLIDGFKPGEIAATVGMSPELVRQRKSRALRKLVDKLRPLSQSGPRVRLNSA